MRPLTRLLTAAAPAVAIVLMLAGILLLRANRLALGTICLALGLCGTVIGVRLADRRPLDTEAPIWPRQWTRIEGAWTVVATLLAVPLLHVGGVSAPDEARTAAAAWITSVLLGLGLTWARRSASTPEPRVDGDVRTQWGEVVMAALIVAAALVVRLPWLSSHPYPWSGDEASVGTEAARILAGEVVDLFATGWSLQPNWSFVPTTFAEWALGRTIVAVRVPSVLAGTLAVLFTYLVARELFNPVVGLVSAAVLATLPYHVHFSRLGVQNVNDSLMAAVVLWLLVRAVKRNDRRYYYSAGAAAGLCLYTYAGTRLVLGLAAALLAARAISRRGYARAHGPGLVAFASAATISAAPQALFFAQHRDIFIGRLGQEGIVFNGWLLQEAARTGRSAWEILADQFTRTFLVFIASAAPGNMFNSPAPYLTVAGSLLFLLGTGHALARWSAPRYLLVLTWFWLVVILGGVLTLNPPANTRLLMALPPMAILVALGATHALAWLRNLRVPERALTASLVGVVSLITWQHVTFYLGEYRSRMYFEDANGEYAMQVGLMARDLGPDVHVLVLGGPRVFADFPTIRFVAPENPRRDVSPAEAAALQLPAALRAGLFATPENRPLLAEIRERYPGGRGGLLYRRAKPDDVLFEYYLVGPGF